ncbi:MAG TPA: trypsin-like peptidase domain-containing protein [Gemmatimonadales bacterium]
MAVLTVLSGSGAGARHRLATDFATLGRHHSSDVRFDAEHELEVSARHAAVFRQGATYVVRDLGSTNGTWLNGSRIRSDRSLEHGDRIRLGARGPEIEFAIVDAAEVTVPPVAARAPLPPESVAGETSEGVKVASSAGSSGLAAQQRQGGYPSTDLRIRMEVARQTDRLRRRIFTALTAGALLVATAVGWIVWNAARERSATARERARLLAEVDSLQRVLANAADEAHGLRGALDSARHEAWALRGSIATGGSEQRDLAALDSVVSEAMVRHTPLVRAAAFDPGFIEESESRSVALLFAEFPDGRAASATGFIARGRGDTAWVVTARHAVRTDRGADPTRIVVTVSRRAGVYKTRLVAVDDSLELAILRIISRTGFRPIRAFAASQVRPGDPVAVIGFPLGLGLPMDRDWMTTGVVPTTTVASVSRVLPDLVQLDGYGVAGVSGSPVFNAAGEVVGLLYGGQPESGGRIVYAVPAPAIRAFLDRVAPVN